MIKIDTPKKRGRPRKNKTENINSQIENDWMVELCALTDWITGSGNDNSLNDISLSTLYTYLKNPYSNIQNIRNASKYLSNKHGVIRDTNNLFRYLPTLNWHLAWSSFDDPKKITKYEKKILNLLDIIDVKKLTRDGMYECAEVGTIVTCLRKEKYVQFLDLDNLVINNMVNGKWVVKFDLDTIKISPIDDVKTIIESLPDEITLAKYNKYKNSGDKKYRYIELANCDVVSINPVRNYPWGIPYSIGAWASLIQKEIINRVERSVADRLIKEILLLVVGKLNEDKNGVGTPVPKEVITYYFNEVKRLLLKKESGSMSTAIANDNTGGIGLATLPDFFKLEPVKVNTTMFTKELYQKINDDIFMGLGVSSTLLYGAGDSTNYSSAQINNEKIFRYIFGLLEQFEALINGYIKKLLPKDLSCVFFFDKTTFLDRDKMIGHYKDFYLQTGIFTPWAEAITGNNYYYSLSMARYEKEVLKIDDYLNPPVNPYTTGGNPDSEKGRPSEDNSDNPNTVKSKTNDGNNYPSPSD